MGKLNFHMPFETKMFLAYNETVWERKEESKEKELVSEGRGVRNSKFEERRLRMLDRQSFSCGCEGWRVGAGRRSEIHGRWHRCWLVHWGIVARDQLGNGTPGQQSCTRCADTLGASAGSGELEWWIYVGLHPWWDELLSFGHAAFSPGELREDQPVERCRSQCGTGQKHKRACFNASATLASITNLMHDSDSEVKTNSVFGLGELVLHGRELLLPLVYLYLLAEKTFSTVLQMILFILQKFSAHSSVTVRCIIARDLSACAG
jgi:hypothetical protein